MVTIKDGCGCDPCDCDWKQKLKEAYARASVSVNKIGDYDGSIYYPDGSGYVKLPIPKLSEVQQISENAQDIADLKVADVRLQANITAEETARKAKDENLDSDIARIDSTDARQSELIQDNADRITSTYNDLVSTEATVATHDSEIITLKANNQALAKSLVSDVIMTDGTTAGSVQVSIEREDGALITSANYRWGKDIGIRLEAGTQEGYVKAVISLSDGTELVSNEYKIVEVLESDVYVTAITLIADQAAGTLGGNISYSNGTTQTINSVSVPTAPGVTSTIETLQGRMTAVEQKNTQQDASISSLNSRVQAIEDTPGVGQFGAGKLGTIAGSTSDGRIKAEDDGTGSVNGWSALKQRVTTAEGQIVATQGDISDLDGRVGTHDTEISGIMSDITAIETKNTQQDTAISGLQTSKVNVAQGTENAGKALVVGPDGNVAPGKVSSGEDWEIYTGELSALFEHASYRFTALYDFYIVATYALSNGNANRGYIRVRKGEVFNSWNGYATIHIPATANRSTTKADPIINLCLNRSSGTVKIAPVLDSSEYPAVYRLDSETFGNLGSNPSTGSPYNTAYTVYYKP